MYTVIKKQEDPTEPTNTKEEIRFEQKRRKIKIADLEWDTFVLQEQLES